ncbi:MAG: hypothetical protein JRJ76_00190 [Deltaproteobacteria bacterium]|nr:hypothetical protein [Deltaproteobacteria bacterium]
MPRKRDFACAQQGDTSKGEAIVHYYEPLVTPHMEASGSPILLGYSSKSEGQRVKIDVKIDGYSFFTIWVKCFNVKIMLELL